MALYPIRDRVVHEHRVDTNTWTAYHEPLPPEQVLELLDRVDDHFDTAVQSLQPRAQSGVQPEED